MIIAVDVETYKKDERGFYRPVLDATGDYFVLGVVYKETGGKKVFYDPKLMWEYIIDLGKKEFKRGKKLTCYGFNIKYDFYQFADLLDRNIRWFSESPFIASYCKPILKSFFDIESFQSWERYAKINKYDYNITYQRGDKVIISYNKEIIKFLDAMSLFKMSLAKLGDLVNRPKFEMPEFWSKKLTNKLLNDIAIYCINDCRIVLDGIHYLRKKLVDDGVGMRNLCTIHQIAISYVINALRKGDNEHVLVPSKNGGLSEFTRKTSYSEEIHAAYRGGFVRVWKTGIIDDMTSIDFNSLYPYSAINMRFPDLRTERHVLKPLSFYSQEDLFSYIGLSRCLLFNKNNKLGLLPVRLVDKAYTVGNGTYLIGTWTHEELSLAIRSGYKVLDVEWSVLFEPGINPFSELYSNLYDKRIKSKSSFDNYFYKSILNSSLGKFGQTRCNQVICIDSVEEIHRYLAKNYQILKGIAGKTDLLYVNKNKFKHTKKYYTPIIPTLVNAFARVTMYKAYSKVPYNALCYTDTDSIITKGDYSKRFSMGEGLGQFKYDEDVITGDPLIGVSGVIWGTKAKCVGNNVALSGVNRMDFDLSDFKKGKISFRKMVGLRSAADQKIGSFITDERDLVRQQADYWMGREQLDQQRIHIDYDIKDLTYFVPHLTTDVLQRK